MATGCSAMAVKEETLEKETLQVAAVSEQGEQTMISQPFYYSPWRFLYVALAIAWSAFAHPFSATVIDLATGEIYHQGQEEEKE